MAQNTCQCPPENRETRPYPMSNPAVNEKCTTCGNVVENIPDDPWWV